MEVSIGDEKYSLPLCAYVAGFGKSSHIIILYRCMVNFEGSSFHGLIMRIKLRLFSGFNFHGMPILITWLYSYINTFYNFFMDKN